MTTITNVASSMTKVMKPRTNTHQLTTGYTDLASDGINNLLGEYSVVFQDTQQNIETLENTLTALNATKVFGWNPYSTFLPLSTEKKFLCEEWETNYATPEKSTLTATFIEQVDI